MYYFLDSQKALLIVEKAFLKESNEIDNKGTNAYISDLIREKEKIN